MFKKMGLKQLLLVIAVMVVALRGWCCDGCLKHEKDALLQIKTSFSYMAEKLSSWGNDADCCNWKFVECDSGTGRVIGLYLWDPFSQEREGMNRYLNVSLFLPFDELRSIDLGYHGFVGCVEDGDFERFSGLHRLEDLNLDYNNFNNDILTSVTRVLSLKSLSFYYNKLKGTINLQELNNLINLEFLNLEYNEIEGFKSLQGDEEVLNLSKLKVLELAYNRLNNNVVSFINNLPSLQSLGISYNRLQGSFEMKELNSLINLKELDLSGNEIRTFLGSIGFNKLSKLILNNVSTNGSSIVLQSLGAFPFLETLYLEENNFEGRPVFHQDSPSLMKLKELYLHFSTLDEKSLENLGTTLPSLKSLSMRSLTRPLSFPGLCNLSHLRALDMSSNNLSGSLPPCFANLTSLQELQLSSNNFTGDIATQGLCSLNHLRALDMSSNNLSGSLPPCLANLTSLQELYLSSNHFTGDITPLGGLTSIQELYLHDNHFQVPLSLRPLFNCSKLKVFSGRNNELHNDTEADDMTPKFQLRSLDLSGHGHGGTFPEFLYHQRELSDINLSNLKIKGGFPYWLLDNNTELRILLLSNNSLSGPLQLLWQPHVNCSYLGISGNQFHGLIPTQIGAYLPNLNYLNMSRNGFNGSIPWSFGDMSWLESLDLSNNKLSGEIPEKLTMGCFQLIQLLLSNNRLQGKIYSKFSNLTNLMQLQLDGNSLTGSIPDGLSNCSSLFLLDFSNNNMSGRIPQWIRNMSFLVILDLSNNSFSGSLPSGFGPSQMREVNLSRNKLRGSIMDAFYNSRMLTTLDLSHNHFIGRLPEWIGSFSELSYFLLSYNYFEGEIPTQLCKLSKLSLIDLSNNKLSGPIPPCLKSSSKWSRHNDSDPYPDRLIFFISNGSYFVPFQRSAVTQLPLEFTTKNICYTFRWSILTYLSGIDLSCNNLTGEIPLAIGNLSTIQVLNLSHNSLSGPIPWTFSNLRQVESLDLSYNNLSGKIPSHLTDLYSLAVFSVAHNNLSGPVPDSILQFATFDYSSYEGNPSLCGPPLTKSCNGAEPPPSSPRTSTKDEKDSGFMDMGVFYISFFVVYIMVLLTIAAVLWINPYWRRAWFYFIEVIITSCYYFLVDNLPVPYKFKVLTPFVLL